MTSHSDEPTGDEVYREVIQQVRDRGLEKLGLMTSWAWYDDPKRLAFTLARYKFVSKMIEGSESALEVGCGDGFGARVVRQSVGALTAVDFDPEFIADSDRDVERQMAGRLSGARPDARPGRGRVRCGLQPRCS